MLGLMLAVLATPSAHALEVGSSVGVAPTSPAALNAFSPSLDLRFEPVIIQIHIMEFLRELADEDVQIGANVLFRAHDAELGKRTKAVVEPGFGLDILANGDTMVAVTGDCRLGATINGAKAGFGVYVVPSIGLMFGDGDVDFGAGGGIQLSTWFGSNG